MNAGIYLEKNNINNELDGILVNYFEILRTYEGKECSSCGFIQGTPAKGFYKYYCDHITNKIDKKLKNQKKEITERLVNFISSQDMQVPL